MNVEDMPIIGNIDLSNTTPFDMPAQMRILKEREHPTGYHYGKSGFDFEEPLFGGDENCDHFVVGQNRGGIKCIHCGAWFCY